MMHNLYYKPEAGCWRVTCDTCNMHAFTATLDATLSWTLAHSAQPIPILRRLRLRLRDLWS